MSASGSAMGRWIDPRSPMSKSSYGVQQFVAILVALGLLRAIDSIGIRGWGSVPIAAVLTGALATLTFMGLLTLKRLRDVGWSRYWCLLIAGPVLMYSLLAIGRSSPVLLREAVIPVGALFLAGCALIVTLFVVPGKEGNGVRAASSEGSAASQRK
jgi:uncharacterized membrane protein YhaH (DUF805 family)